MFARKRTSVLRCCSFSCGAKLAKTLSCVSRVFATFRSNPYSPLQKNVFSPDTRCRPSRLMRRPLKTDASSSPKSSPTTATIDTSLKNEAATEKYVAEPPMQRSTLPNGVSSASNATLPTTRMPIEPSLDVFADDRREIVLHLRRDARGIGDDRVLERGRARTSALPPRHARHGRAEDLLRHLGIRAQH